ISSPSETRSCPQAPSTTIRLINRLTLRNSCSASVGAWVFSNLSIAAAGSGERSMQTLMHDQPQPPCSPVEYNSTDCRDADHHGSKYQALREPPATPNTVTAFVRPFRFCE